MTAPRNATAIACLILLECLGCKGSPSESSTVNSAAATSKTTSFTPSASPRPTVVASAVTACKQAGEWVMTSKLDRPTVRVADGISYPAWKGGESKELIGSSDLQISIDGSCKLTGTLTLGAHKLRVNGTVDKRAFRAEVTDDGPAGWRGTLLSDASGQNAAVRMSNRDGNEARSGTGSLARKR